MGIIEQELASTCLTDGTDVTIEYNEGDVIHIHIDRFRIDCSLEEFQELATATKDAKMNLISVKDGIQQQ
jgi:hypothetical protein